MLEQFVKNKNELFQNFLLPSKFQLNYSKIFADSEGGGRELTLQGYSKGNITDEPHYYFMTACHIVYDD